MAEQAAQWSAHDVTQRFGDAARPTELRELAANLDSLLNHIGAVMRHEQQMAAELSHELKTPLDLIVAENDLLMAHETVDPRRSQGLRVIAETAERMNRLLDTLLANAGRYAHSQIGVRADRHHETIAIVVTDDGPGVPADFRDNAFEPGSRADPTDQHPGPGLGLALARRLARSSGGDISVQDSASGAAFSVVLPAG
jgi:signal transduction histidine kinase